MTKPGSPESVKERVDAARLAKRKRQKKEKHIPAWFWVLCFTGMLLIGLATIGGWAILLAVVTFAIAFRQVASKISIQKS